MKIADFIAPDDVVKLAVPDKTRLLQALAQAAAERFGLDTAMILRMLSDREALGSTGIGNGIALPHARLDTIDRVHGLLAVLAKPVQYGSLDDRPVDLVVLLLLPASVPEDQLRCLACVARRFKEPGLPDKLRLAPDAELYPLLTG